MLASFPQLYTPAGANEGGNGINDLPGTNDSDPRCVVITKEGIEAAGVVMVLLERDLAASQGSISLLVDAGVVERVLREDETQQQVVFLFNRMPMLI